VHPYDDPRIIAGQGTIALEMLQDVPDLDTLVVPVGGGGMIAGCAVAARGLKPEVKVIGVESAGYSAMHQLLAGKPVTVGGDTIAEGIAVRDIGKTPLAIARALVDRVLTVDEVAIEHAIALFLEVEKTVAEGAGAAGLAALLAHPQHFTGRKVGLVLCGGNIDTRLLASVLLRGLVRDGRIARLRLMIGDLPGQLARVAGLIGKAGGNIVEVQHQRLFGVVAKATELDVTVETRGRDHMRELVTALEAEGFKVRVLEGAEA
jgi:threonine dehydratase